MNTCPGGRRRGQPCTFIAKVRLTDALPGQPYTFIAEVRLREASVGETHVRNEHGSSHSVRAGRWMYDGSHGWTRVPVSGRHQAGHDHQPRYRRASAKT